MRLVMLAALFCFSSPAVAKPSDCRKCCLECCKHARSADSDMRILLPEEVVEPRLGPDAPYFERGLSHFFLDEYAQAIRAWEDGFAIAPNPDFVYWMAEAHRLSDHPQEALELYRRYLEMEPRAANRGQVRRQIARLAKSNLK